MREYFEELENQILSPLAVKSADSKGRSFDEPIDLTRTCFQRDRDRIIHSKAFRRLKHKTQVFISTKSDHVRSRLTHSIEVAQISRHMARLLRLNEDLTEAIALAHDLGHPPFGHAGETQLDTLMKDNGGFEHNQQSLRIVELLESKYPGFKGLNLSHEVKSGIQKHKTPFDHPKDDERLNFISLEAQVVNIADEITYTSHDIDDALHSRILTESDLEKNVTIWREFSNKVLSEHANISQNQYLCLMNSRLITSQIMNVIESSKSNILKFGIQSCDDLQSYSDTSLIAFSSEFREQINELRTYLFDNYYTHHDIYRSNKRGQMIISDLFKALSLDIKLIPKSFYGELNNQNKERIVCDYISGMTDSYAVQEHQSLFT